MGSLVIESTSSCPEYLQLSRHLYLSGVPTVLESTSSCPKYLRLSRAPRGGIHTQLATDNVILTLLGRWVFTCDVILVARGSLTVLIEIEIQIE